MAKTRSKPVLNICYLEKRLLVSQTRLFVGWMNIALRLLDLYFHHQPKKPRYERGMGIFLEYLYQLLMSIDFGTFW